MGIAPLFFLTSELVSAGKTCHLFMGAKNKTELYLRDELIRLVPGLQVSTDDGSAGYHGFVTELAASAIAGMKAPVYACGPGPMLQETARMCTRYQRELFLSLEAYMACGVGACLGCTVTIHPGEETHYRRVCVDGPVFRGEEVFPRDRA
jgi:dihydroorotate dehydrogenase electron transfer subunit